MTTRTLIFGLVCSASSLLYGQTGSIAGPSSGFVFDSSARALLQIRGIPGASLVGDPVDFGFDLAWAAVSPGLDSALVAAAAGGVHLFRLNNGTAVERPVDGLAPAQHVVYSPSGTAAVLYTAGSLQVLQGLPDAPVIAASLSLGTARTAEFAAASLGRTRRLTDAPLAVSDDGGYLICISGGAVRLIGISGDNRKLMDAGTGVMAAFAPGSHDASVVNPTGAGLVIFRDVSGSSIESVVAPSDSGTASPAGLAFSTDGRRLFLASASARSIAAFDLTSGDRSTVACDCAPTGLSAMGSVFRLNELGSEPLWLLDARTAEAKTLFVPARGASN